MSESASWISLFNFIAMAREILFPPGVCVTLSFPLLFPLLFPFPSPVVFGFPFLFPFPCSVTFPFPCPSVVPFPFPVTFSLPWVSSSPLPLSLSSPSPGRLLPLLSASGSAQFSTSFSSLIMSSQFSCPTGWMSPGLYCRQFGSSIITLRSLLSYKENCSLVRWIFPQLVISGVQQSTGSPEAHRLSHLQ